MAELHEASAFLQALGGGSFIFQTFTDRKDSVPKGQRDPLARVLIGSFEEHQDQLAKLNAMGAGVFVQINEGEQRGKDHVTKVRAIFIDLDEPKTASESIKEVKAHLPKPSIISQSSKGKYHIYWSCTGLAVDDFTKVQKALAIKFGGDTAMGNKDRVMRLPGFMHRKGKAQPVSATLFDCTYKATDVVKAITKATCNVTLPDTPVKRKAKASSDCFGLDIGDGYEVPEEVGKGGRVNELVRHIGKLVQEGWGEAEVMARLLKFNAEKCNPPVDKSRLEREVFPSIGTFSANRQAEIKIPTPPPAPSANAIPPPPTSANAIPPPPVVEAKVWECPRPCTLKTASDNGYSNEGSNPEMYQLENWLARFVWVIERSRVGDRSAKGDALMSEMDFKNSMSALVIDKAVMFNQWKTSAERIIVRDEIYYPEAKEFISRDSQNYWNTYSPSPIKPVAEYDEGKVEPFLNLINFLCNGAKKDIETFLNWIAFTYQKPTIRIPWSPIVLSEPGAGKGLLYNILREVMGKRNSTMIQHDRLDKDFNSFLYQTTFVAIDEMESSTRTQLTKLKSFITETSLEINTKGVKETSREIFPNIIIFTNKADAIPIEDKDRRFWVIEVEGVEKQSFYNTIDTWKADKENIAHLMGYLAARKIAPHWHNDRPVMNAAKHDMMELSKTELERSFDDALKAREGVFAADVTCFKSVKDYMELRMDADLNTYDTKCLTKLLAKASCKVKSWASKTLTLRVQGAAIKQRPKCLRNAEHWEKQDGVAIAYELKRSHQMALGRGEVDPPAINIVEGEA